MCSELWNPNNNKIGGYTWANFWSASLKNWTTTCFTFSDAGLITVYQNGVKFGDSQQASPVPLLYRTLNYIGKNNWAGVQTTNAMIDELRMYDYELSAAEVKTLHDRKSAS